MPPSIRHTEHIGVRVRDLDAALRFYHDTLGLPIADRRVMESGNEIVFLQIGNAGYVELIARQSGNEFSAAQQVPNGQAGLQHFALLVDDLDAWVEYLRAREVPLRGQPFAFEMTQEKCRGLFIADPEGNPVELFERTPK